MKTLNASILSVLALLASSVLATQTALATSNYCGPLSFTCIGKTDSGNNITTHYDCSPGVVGPKYDVSADGERYKSCQVRGGGMFILADCVTTYRRDYPCIVTVMNLKHHWPSTKKCAICKYDDFSQIKIMKKSK